MIIYRSVNDLNVFKIHAVDFDSNLKIAQHVYQHDHSMDFENVKIIDRARNYHKRLYLEAWYSQRDPNSRNGFVDIPDIYASLHS